MGCSFFACFSLEPAAVYEEASEKEYEASQVCAGQEASAGGRIVILPSTAASSIETKFR